MQAFVFLCQSRNLIKLIFIYVEINSTSAFTPTTKRSNSDRQAEPHRTRNPVTMPPLRDNCLLNLMFGMPRFCGYYDTTTDRCSRPVDLTHIIEMQPRSVSPGNYLKYTATEQSWFQSSNPKCEHRL
jgi:hypothetical protein